MCKWLSVHISEHYSFEIVDSDLLLLINIKYHQDFSQDIRFLIQKVLESYLIELVVD